MKQRFTGILLIIALVGALCACGDARQIQTRGGERATVVISGTEALSEGETAPVPVGWNEELISDNGEVKVSIHDDDFAGIPETMSVVTVRPKIVTGEMVRQAAEAIFGDATLYEYGWMLTRAEIEERIAAWEEGVTTEAIRAFHGEDLSEEMIEKIRATRQNILNYYREAWAYAPEELTQKEC